MNFKPRLAGMVIGCLFAGTPPVNAFSEDMSQSASSLQETVSRMKAARDRLESDGPDATTQSLQKQVIEDLAKLLERAKNSPPPTSSSPQTPPPSNSQKPQSGQNQESSSPNRPQGEKPSSPQQQRQELPPAPPDRSNRSENTDSGSGGSTSGPQSKSGEDSSDQISARSGPANAVTRKSLQTDIWGHLPPQVRQQLLNGLQERTLPGYEDAIHQFYESLVTKSAGKARRNSENDKTDEAPAADATRIP